MSELRPTRGRNDLADMVELLLDKGVVVNADIAVSVGDTELLDVHVRAAVASFETAAQYGLEFPSGTDMERVEAIADRTGGTSVSAASTDRDESSSADGATQATRTAGRGTSGVEAPVPAAETGWTAEPTTQRADDSDDDERTADDER